MKNIDTNEDDKEIDTRVRENDTRNKNISATNSDVKFSNRTWTENWRHGTGKTECNKYILNTIQPRTSIDIRSRRNHDLWKKRWPRTGDQ